MTIPTHANNIFNINIDNLSSNGNINFGNAIQEGLSANDKASGGQEIFGDLNQSGNLNFNIIIDPDATDQPQTQI